MSVSTTTGWVETAGVDVALIIHVGGVRVTQLDGSVSAWWFDVISTVIRVTTSRYTIPYLPQTDKAVLW